MGRKYKTKHAWKIHDVVQLRCEGYTYREIIYMVSIDNLFNSLAPRESDTNLNIGPGHVWVPSCNNSLPEPMVTEVRVTIPGPQWVNSLLMIAYYPPMDQWMEVSRQTCEYEYIYMYMLVLYTHTHPSTDMTGVGIMNQNIILEARHNKDVGSGRQQWIQVPSHQASNIILASYHKVKVGILLKRHGGVMTPLHQAYDMMRISYHDVKVGSPVFHSRV